MKTQRDEMKRTYDDRFLLHKNNFALLVILFFALSSCSTPSLAQRASIQINLQLPSWAPDYSNNHLVRYYYLPDIECYYDVRNREFIYMEDGEWMFGRSLPPVYAWLDLNDCFIVALDTRVIEPWRHFRYYVSHYPRYYYRTVYRDRYQDRDHPLRGFNENEREVVYNRRSERDDNSYDRRNEPRREENNRSGERKELNNKRDYPERRVESTHPSEPVKYYGREVGKPVRVQRNMKRGEEIKVREEKQPKEYRQR
ncbi:MAG: hypothetical protein WCI31_09970 [Prolixibacteraceae bacterium]